MKIENENTFKQAINSGINLFVGAGFSVLAKDEKGRGIPTGRDLLGELNKTFGKHMNSLPMLCTVLNKTKQKELNEYLTSRFVVGSYPAVYNNLSRCNVKAIFTTNIDNLIPQIFEKSLSGFLNRLSRNGESTDSKSIDYLPLHGNVEDNDSPYLFSSVDLANAYNLNPRDWYYLKASLEKHPTLFLGYSIGDDDTLQALTNDQKSLAIQKDKWILLKNPDEDVKEYFQALGFNIIEGDIRQFLNYVGKVPAPIEQSVGLRGIQAVKELYGANVIPPKKSPVIRPIADFFKGMPPTWSDIISGNICQISHFQSIVNSIYNKHRNTIVIGAPLSGKTTVALQAVNSISDSILKLHFNDLTMSKSEFILKLLDGEKAIVVVEDFVDDTDAFLKLSQASNLVLVGIDRSHTFETVSNKFSSSRFDIINVTDLNDSDFQSVYKTLPIDLRKEKMHLCNRCQYKTDSIFEFVINNIKGQTIRDRYRTVFDEMSDRQPDLLFLLVLCAYMHSCRIPLSIEVANRALDNNDIRSTSQLLEHLHDLLNDYDSDELEENVSYYYPRSYVFADTILKKASHHILSDVMMSVIDLVPQQLIPNYYKFKRYGYDKTLALRAFPGWKEGRAFYEKAFEYDKNNPYVLQQGALYLSAKRQYEEAFKWIDRAKTLTNDKFFSIRNSHAIILFDANIDKDLAYGAEEQLDSSMKILENCYNDDQRKTFHALVFAHQAMKYYKRISSDKTIGYLLLAKRWLSEEKEKQTWNKDIRKPLKDVADILTAIQND